MSVGHVTVKELCVSVDPLLKDIPEIWTPLY